MEGTNLITRANELKAKVDAARAAYVATSLEYSIFRYQLLTEWFKKYFTEEDAIAAYRALLPVTNNFNRDNLGYLQIEVQSDHANIVEFRVSLHQANEHIYRNMSYSLDLAKIGFSVDLWRGPLVFCIPIDGYSEEKELESRRSTRPNAGLYIRRYSAFDVTDLYLNGGIDKIGMVVTFTSNSKHVFRKNVI